MTLLREKDKAGRTHLQSRFMNESLVSRETESASVVEHEVDIIPTLNVIHVGGKSIIDRGRIAVFPLIDEFVSIKEQGWKFVIGVSGGARVRHTMAIGLDLGIPVGGLATVVGAIEEQNATMMYSLMAKYGAVRVPKDHYTDLPHYLDNGMIPILTSNPPHHYWEKPPKDGVLPEHGPDFGSYMTAEGLGARSMIFVKDVDGLFDKDPNRNNDARFIPRISAAEVLSWNNGREDLLLDRTVFEMLARARHVKEIRIVNGLKAGEIRKAINEEPAGTTVYKE